MENVGGSHLSFDARKVQLQLVDIAQEQQQEECQCFGLLKKNTECHLLLD